MSGRCSCQRQLVIMRAVCELRCARLPEQVQRQRPLELFGVARARHLQDALEGVARHYDAERIRASRTPLPTPHGSRQPHAHQVAPQASSKIRMIASASGAASAQHLPI